MCHQRYAEYYTLSLVGTIFLLSSWKQTILVLNQFSVFIFQIRVNKPEFNQVHVCGKDLITVQKLKVEPGFICSTCREVPSVLKKVTGSILMFEKGLTRVWECAREKSNLIPGIRKMK